MKGHQNRYSKWNFQSPPTPKHQRGKPVYSMGPNFPNFGRYKEERDQETAKLKKMQRDSLPSTVSSQNSSAKNAAQSTSDIAIPRIQVRSGTSPIPSGQHETCPFFCYFCLTKFLSYLSTLSLGCSWNRRSKSRQFFTIGYQATSGCPYR